MTFVARDKRLLLDDFAMPLQIGSLDPIEEESGRNARLANLGHLLDPSDSSDSSDADDVHRAVEEFQADNELGVALLRRENARQDRSLDPPQSRLGCG